MHIYQNTILNSKGIKSASISVNSGIIKEKYGKVCMVVFYWAIKQEWNCPICKIIGNETS